MRIVVALGGNALEKPEEKGTYEELMKNVRTACEEIVELVRRGDQVLVTHGNGPQVGNLALQQEKSRGDLPVQPLHVLGAMTQGQIGYMLQQTLQNLMTRENLSRPIVTLMTQVLVSRADEAFKNPTKPIGPFYDSEAAERLRAECRYVMMKVKPEGVRVFRRVVPSPDPIRIIESDVIKRLTEEGVVVIASGGGGIPVVSDEKGGLQGVDAVIDKDLAAEKLAEAVKADTLLILTDIDSAKLDYGKPGERSLRQLSVSEAKGYLAEGQFLSGSMKPKVQACVRFMEWGGSRAIIAPLGRAAESLKGSAGTVFAQA